MPSPMQIALVFMEFIHTLHFHHYPNIEELLFFWDVFVTVKDMVVKFICSSSMPAPTYMIIGSLSAVICFSNIGDLIAKITDQEIQNIQTVAISKTLNFPG